MAIPKQLREQVWKRAKSRCEYCRMPQEYDPITFEIDHVIPEKMHGRTAMENLALACFHDNNGKGPNVAGIDPQSGERTFLYHPRSDKWGEHFVWDRPLLQGITPQGRATVALLQINRADRVIVRQSLMDEGVFLFE